MTGLLAAALLTSATPALPARPLSAPLQAGWPEGAALRELSVCRSPACLSAAGIAVEEALPQARAPRSAASRGELVRALVTRLASRAEGSRLAAAAGWLAQAPVSVNLGRERVEVVLRFGGD
jgi:hypothetical protein